MDEELQKKIYEALPELDPKDPRSINYIRKLNYNNDIHVSFLKFFISLGIVVILFYFINSLFNTNNLLKLLSLITLFYIFMGKLLLILIIKIYQNYVSDDIRNKCRFEPSCSNYALLVLKKYSIQKAVYLIVNRLYRCSYTDGGGFENIT